MKDKMDEAVESVTETDWNKIHEERKNKREEVWAKHLPALQAIAMVKHIRADNYRMALPNLGFCDFFVRADKLKPQVSGVTYINGFKMILKVLDLYIFEGELKDKDL